MILVGRTGSPQAKLWAGRFNQPTNEFIDRLNASLPFDRRFAGQDIRGSIAHARMLVRQDIIREDDGRTIEDGLRQILG